MKVNFETYTYGNERFEGATVSPNYGNSYFGLTADNIATLDYTDDGAAVRLKFFMERKSLWDYYGGLDMAEFHITPELDLRKAPISAAFLGTSGDFAVRDLMQGGLLVIKTPSGTHQVYLDNNSRGSSFEDSYMTFTAQGQYQISLLFSSWYRYNKNLVIGSIDRQYHIFTYKFQITRSGGAVNLIDSVLPEGNDVFRFDARSGKIERQKRADDFYYWKDCDIESMTYDFSNSLGQKFYNVTYSYGGVRRTESVREEFTPNYQVTDC